MIKDQEEAKCFHCGEECQSTGIHYDEKIFCCSGCRMVYEILSRGGAGDYYRLSRHPGIKVTGVDAGKRFDFLDNEEIRAGLLDFSDNGVSRVKFYIPSIHCSSCIWLLENLHRLHPGIIHSSVYFTRKQATFTFRDQEICFDRPGCCIDFMGHPDFIHKQNKDKYRMAGPGFRVQKSFWRIVWAANLLFGFPYRTS